MAPKRIVICLGIASLLVASGCGNTSSTEGASSGYLEDIGLEKTGSLELDYASCFSVDFYEDGYAYITISDENHYLLVPQDADIPKELPKDVVVIPEQAGNIYVSGSATMDFFRELKALDCVKMTSTDSSDWSIPEIAERIDNYDLYYIGKYSAPDYEALLELSCDLAVENTMIWHSPEVKDKIEELGIPVLMDYSSYEENPLGRLEWIKLYGVLTGHLDEAQNFFDGKVESVEQIAASELTEDAPSVAFFYISANGNAVVRRPGDYLSKMIAMAGGRYIIPEEAMKEDDSTSATINMQMETFYAYASEADMLIYNSTIAGEIYTIDELIEKEPLLADFKAVQNGMAFCTNSNMFQQTTGIADMILDFHKVISNPGNDSDLTFLHKLK